jgi:hypothetical protein
VVPVAEPLDPVPVAVADVFPVVDPLAADESPVLLPIVPAVPPVPPMLPVAPVDDPDVVDPDIVGSVVEPAPVEPDPVVPMPVPDCVPMLDPAEPPCVPDVMPPPAVPPDWPVACANTAVGASATSAAIK